MKVAVINSPERVEKDDIENLRMVLSKYAPVESVVTVRGYDSLIMKDIIVGPPTGDIAPLNRIPRTLTSVISPANYKVINELLDEADVLIMFPALDRTGLCENIINRWFRLHGYDNLEIL